MKKIFILVPLLILALSSSAQLDTLPPTKLTVGLSISQLVSTTIPAVTAFANKRIGKRHYLDAQAGLVTIFAKNSTDAGVIDKVRGGRFSLAYRIQRERSIFHRTCPYIGISLDYDYLKGNGRTTYTRANGAFFQRYAFTNVNTFYSTNLIVGFVFNMDEFMTIELGGKLGRGHSTEKVTSSAPNDAILNNENAFKLAQDWFNILPKGGEDFTSFRIMLRIGYVIN